MSTTSTNLSVMGRNRAGTSGSRAVRLEGFIPAILYGDSKENENIKVDIRHIVKGMHTPGFMATVLDLDVDGKKQKAIVRDIQLHPVTDQPIHVDFLRVSAKSKIHVNIPVEFINEDKCPGIKNGGVLNIVLHEIEIVCPADKLPDHLTIDLEGLEVGNSIHSDILKLPTGAKLANAERDATVATIVAPTLKTQEEDDAEAAEAAEASEASLADGKDDKEAGAEEKKSSE